MHYERCFDKISDDDLLRRLASLLGESRGMEAELVAHMGEVDARRLYAREAMPSMFEYCVRVLHLSEAEAYLRIGAARAAREHPAILDMLGAGRLHLSGIARLAPHLRRENASALLERAACRSKRQIEELIAELAPRPDAPTVVRKLPERPKPALASALSAAAVLQLRPDGVASTVTSAPSIEVLAPARYKVQFTVSAELREKLERLQKLMRVPTADLAEVIDHLVTRELERRERRRFGHAKGPAKEVPKRKVRASGRYIAAAIRRAVYARDGGQCRYTDDLGRRCPEKTQLEYHHRYPYGLGGDGRVGNLALLCPAHNQYLAERDYGRTAMERHRAGARPVPKGRAI